MEPDPQPKNGWRVIEGFCDAEDMDSPKKIVDLYMVRGSITREDRSFWLCWEHAPATGPARAARWLWRAWSWARYAGRELVRRFPWRLWSRFALFALGFSAIDAIWDAARDDIGWLTMAGVCAISNACVYRLCRHNARKQPPRSGAIDGDN